MPIYTATREEFKIAVQKIVGDLYPSQVSIKTGISDTYIYKMLNGRVPSEAILERFAKGMGVDLTELRIAAGYEQSDDPASVLEIALKAKGGITEAKREEIVETVRRMLAEVE